MDTLLSSLHLFAKSIGSEPGRYIFHTIPPASQYAITIWSNDAKTVVERADGGLWKEIQLTDLNATLIPLVVTRHERYGFRLLCTYEQQVSISYSS